MRYKVVEIGSGRHLGSITADLEPHSREPNLFWLTRQVPVWRDLRRDNKITWIWTRPADRSRVLALPGFAPTTGMGHRR